MPALSAAEDVAVVAAETFARDVLAPGAAEWEGKQELPREAFAQLAEQAWPA